MNLNWIGRVILDRYRVERFLASGGMGAVYQVWDLRRSVPLAMKVLHFDLADDPSFFRRFQREANALKKLNHPNIVPFYGIEQYGEIALILEAYIDGPTLKRVLGERRTLPVIEMLIYLKALCSSLSYAHNNRIVHCDVKPGNVLIDRSGSVFLTDFGIARQADATVTTTFASSGTPAYMAPEQVRGESVSSQTDVYALGILLFEMLTGQRPFRGTEMEAQAAGPTLNERIRYAQLRLPPPDPRSINPSISPGMAAVILKALQKDPRDRFNSAQDLLLATCEAVGVQPYRIPDRVTLLPAAPENPAPTSPLEGSTPLPSPEVSPRRPRLPGKLSPVFFALGGVVLLVAIVLLATRGLSHSAIPIVSGVNQAQPSATNRIGAPYRGETSTAAPTTLPTLTPDVLTDMPTAWPTVTLEPVITPTNEDFNAPLYYPLSGCAPSHVHVGDWAMITFGSGANAIRSEPDTHPANKIGLVQPGELIRITEGPVCNYGWLLWRVRSTTGLDGWTPETDGASFFIEPFPINQPCPGAPPSLLHRDDQAQVTLFPPKANRVRALPNLDGDLVGMIDPGEVMTIIEGPQCSGGYVWWKINHNGLTGWTAEGDSVDHYLVPVPKKH